MGIVKHAVSIFEKKAMKSWSVELTCGTETLGEVPIER